MKNLSYNFDHKVAFVSGAATGIGRATALAFSAYGASVVVADVNEKEGAHTAALIKDSGKPALFLKCDVSSDGDIRNAIETTVSKFGRIDFAFNNAGIEGESKPLYELSERTWNHVIDVNLKGVWLSMKYQLPYMLKQKTGAIVNCASIAGLVGFPGMAAYVASKHGVVGLTKAAALEYAKANIRINAICPGVIHTPMVDRVIHDDPLVQKQLEAGEPMGRMGSPDEIASAALWLCSEQSSFVTGHPMVVDGGWVAQ